ncbi:flavin reductase family protein [Amycolatopsis jejuensis]|uniref:flavin reductase family protein n=1 Tax=Amycolatopsis jejuensis TaxID=330084 RepID=UPI0005253BC7|nr:flavin reductase family protein [Amycolatopsis jejuensis]
MTTAPIHLRKMFGAFPSGVAALCAQAGGRPIGMAASTFTPVSLDPPLVSVCIRRSSGTWARLRRLPSLGVSILGADHERAARQLSAKAGDRFTGLKTVPTPDGALHLAEACAWFECALDAELPAGDHVIAVLRITRTGHGEAGEPLVFHASRYRRLAQT